MLETRKKMEEKKDYEINRKEVRFNSKEFKILNNILEKNFNNCFADFVKYPLYNEVDYIKNKHIKSREKVANGLQELSKIGSNFNQIARYLNTNKDKFENVSYAKLSNSLDEIANQLEAIQNKILS